jgi:PAS domain S-box-containing protein
MLRPIRRSLRARLVAYFLVLSTITVTVVGLAVYVRASNDLTASIYDRLDAVAGIKADALARWIAEQQRNVVFIGVMPGVGDDARDLLDPTTGTASRDAAAARLRDVLARVVGQTADAQEIYITDLDGTIRLSTVADHEGRSVADQPFYEAGSTHLAVQNPYTSPLTGRSTITVASPLFDADGSGRKVAILVADLSLKRVDQIVRDDTGLGATGRAFLVGGDGQLITDRTGTGGAIGSRAVDGLLAGESGQALYPASDGSPVIGVYRWLADRNAGIIAEIAQDEAFGPARELALTIGVVGLFSALMLAIGIWLVARRVTRPILALADTAARVQAGDLEATSGIHAEDEVGALAAAFDGMTAQLREDVELLERRVEERTAELTEALARQAAAERQYRSLVEQLPLAVYRDAPGDALGASQYVSPPIEAIFGYPMEDWLQEGFFGTIIHPDDREMVLGKIDRMVETSDAAGGIYRVIAKDGRVVWVRDDVRLVRDEQGEPEYMLGFFLDVTEQAEAEAELRRQKQYFESLVNVSPVAVVTMNRDERVSAWNPAASALFGYSADEAIGRPIDDLILRSDALREEGHDLARQALDTGSSHLNSQRMRRDGSVVDVEIVMVPLVIDGDHVGYYAIYHDITELEAARRDADAANQAKSSFLAAMSHEIRTPMNAVIGMSGLLLDTRLDDEQRDFAETIHSSGEALLTIINDILDFSKIEAGRFDLDSHPFDLAKTIDGAVAVLRPAAQKKRIELTATLAPDLPRTVIGDAGRLRQIVLNLLSNAVKFTATGGVRIDVRGGTVGAEAGGSTSRWPLEIEVSDTGMGIPADRIDRLFQSFSQADASIARRFGGTGLGLAISRRLAELMGGTITASSSGVPGEGSTFRLTALLEIAPDAAVSDAPAASSSAAAAPATGQPAIDQTLATRVPHRILLADDTPFNQKLAAKLLERLGYDVDVVASGLAALDALDAPEGSDYDLVFMDVQMPELDGLETTRRIRAMWPDRALRIVAMTANAMEGDREACLEAGMDDYLSKPIRPDALAAVLIGAGSTRGSPVEAS